MKSQVKTVGMQISTAVMSSLPLPEKLLRHTAPSTMTLNALPPLSGNTCLPLAPPLELPHPALRKHNASPRYQPHQLVALCFNTLAGHDCEHCALLRHSMSHDHHSTASPDSTRTLSHHEADDEKQKDGGEKGGRSSGPPAPVGLFDKRLNATRLRIIGLWLRTGEWSMSAHASRQELIALQF